MRVLHADGTPARRVDVDAGWDSGTTDADGRVSFSALAVGPTSIVAAAHGFTATVVCVEVGTVETVEIREAEPRLVRVTVKDASGMPVPSACVGASCRNVIDEMGERRSVTWSAASTAQLDQGAEEIAPRTDRLGVAVLRVPRGLVKYTAALGKAETEVTSDEDAVEIVLEDPYAAAAK